MPTDRLSLLVVLVLVALAGCAGGDGGPATTPTPDGTAADGDGASTDWCPVGQTMQLTNPQTGEMASWEVKGVVESDGRQACRVTWQTNQGEIRRVDLFFTEDESYRKMITYDAEGVVLSEVRLDDGGSGPATDGSVDHGETWCGEATSMQFMDPQTGEQASFDVQGLVEHEGRTVCKAVWQTNQGDIRRVEMYFNEDRSYQQLIYYDAEGNVVTTIQVGEG